MRNLTPDEFKNILIAHALWLKEDAQGAVVRWGRRADFRGCDLRRFDLSKYDLRGADFTGANLSRVNFRGARLEGATFEHATMIGADLRGAILDRADLRYANLWWARLDGARLIATDLRFTCIYVYFGVSIQPEQVASSILDIHQFGMLERWKELERNLRAQHQKYLAAQTLSRPPIPPAQRAAPDTLPGGPASAAPKRPPLRRRLFADGGNQIG